MPPLMPMDEEEDADGLDMLGPAAALAGAPAAPKEEPVNDFDNVADKAFAALSTGDTNAWREALRSAITIRIRDMKI